MSTSTPTGPRRALDESASHDLGTEASDDSLLEPLDAAPRRARPRLATRVRRRAVVGVTAVAALAVIGSGVVAGANGGSGVADRAEAPAAWTTTATPASEGSTASATPSRGERSRTGGISRSDASRPPVTTSARATEMGRLTASASPTRATTKPSATATPTRTKTTTRTKATTSPSATRTTTKAPTRSASKVSIGDTSGLAANTVAVMRAVKARYPQVSLLTAGSQDHATGHAVDIMVSGGMGDEIAAYVRANASSLGVHYIIWSQKIWNVQRSSEGWRPMSDRGSTTANHYDHVHVSVS